MFKNIFKKKKIHLFLRWFYPGIRLKRWIFLCLLSIFVVGIGLSGSLGEIFKNFALEIIDVRPLAKQIQSLRTIDFVLMIMGIAGIILAFRRGFYAIVTMLWPAREKVYATSLLKRLRLKRGPKIVVIGGGTGLPTLLSGLNSYTANLSAIVTMADDGGSSGRLRREYQALPPGDIRNCLIAMAETSPLMNKLFQHRFQGEGGGIEGHSLGNLFITALSEITGDFASGVKAASQVLAVSGKVLPVTLDQVSLVAEFEDGTSITGESKIGASGRSIRKIKLFPEEVKLAPDIKRSLAEADAIVMGPGSLYTSILPNLLVKGMVEEINQARAIKIYVCNVMTQPGETDGMAVRDHVRAMLDHTKTQLVHYVVTNTQLPNKELLNRYQALGAQLVIADDEDVKYLAEKGIALVRGNLAVGKDLFRHDEDKLARQILKLVVI